MADESARKSLELYELIASRCESRRFSPHQAKAYREMIEFMRPFGSAKEMSAAIKNSPYYLAPSAALIQDKAFALAQAAAENDMEDVAEIYRNKIAEIENDPMAMYDTAYEAQAQKLKNQHELTRQAFVECYKGYVSLVTAQANDETVIEDAISQIRKAKSQLSLPSDDFATLSRIQTFRSLAPVTDEGYERFVAFVDNIDSRSTTENDGIQDDLSQEIATAWNNAQALKDAIVESGRPWLSESVAVDFICHAPADAQGHYAYSQEN